MLIIKYSSTYNGVLNAILIIKPFSCKLNIKKTQLKNQINSLITIYTYMELRLCLFQQKIFSIK